MSSAVNKAFNVIRVLRRAPAPLTLTEIAREAKIAPSTAHSIVSELAAQGAVVQDDRRFRLGPSMFYYGAAYARSAPVYQSTWRDLIALADDARLTAVSAVAWQHQHLILNVHSNASSRMEVAFGGRVPIDAGAWGKAYFAWSGEPLPAELPAYTPSAITDVAQYEQEVERSRQRGYAVDLEEFVVGAGAVAAGVTSGAGFEGIIAIVGLTSELTNAGEDEVGRQLALIAGRSSYALGDQSRVYIVGEE